VLLGIVVVVAGVFLAAAPLSAARATARARFAPYSTDDKTVRVYRLAGAAIALLGLAIAVLA
jgi:hypothetical protein